MSWAATRVMTWLSILLLVALGAVGVSGEYGWNECLVSPQDEWKLSTEDTPALQMRYDYARRYTCEAEKGERGFARVRLCRATDTSATESAGGGSPRRVVRRFGACVVFNSVVFFGPPSKRS